MTRYRFAIIFLHHQRISMIRQIMLSLVIFSPNGNGNQQISHHQVNIQDVLMEQHFQSQVNQYKVCLNYMPRFLQVKDQSCPHENANELDVAPDGQTLNEDKERDDQVFGVLCNCDHFEHADIDAQAVPQGIGSYFIVKRTEKVNQFVCNYNRMVIVGCLGVASFGLCMMMAVNDIFLRQGKIEIRQSSDQDDDLLCYSCNFKIIADNRQKNSQRKAHIDN